MSPRGWACLPFESVKPRENGSGTGQRANADPFLDRYDLATEGSGPVHIVPTADSTQTPPPNQYLERMARVDGCPECVNNAEAPYRIEERSSGFAAYYGCESCGYFWSTSWGA